MGLGPAGWLEEEGAGVSPALPVWAPPPWLRPLSIPKVSFQHEVYPVEPAPGPVAPGEELEEQPLSRQVFIVQELEIRDRLASSRINKFLYLHTSERMPRRAHSNMVLRRCRRPPGQGAGSHATHALTRTHAPGSLASPGPGAKGPGRTEELGPV